MTMVTALMFETIPVIDICQIKEAGSQKVLLMVGNEDEDESRSESEVRGGPVPICQDSHSRNSRLTLQSKDLLRSNEFPSSASIETLFS